VHGLRGDDAYGFHGRTTIKKPESGGLSGLIRDRFELALAAFVREVPLRPQAKIKSAHCVKDSESGGERQTTGVPCSNTLDPEPAGQTSTHPPIGVERSELIRFETPGSPCTGMTLQRSDSLSRVILAQAGIR
jgi:hypothetical protein